MKVTRFESSDNVSIYTVIPNQYPIDFIEYQYTRQILPRQAGMPTRTEEVCIGVLSFKRTALDMPQFMDIQIVADKKITLKNIELLEDKKSLYPKSPLRDKRYAFICKEIITKD